MLQALSVGIFPYVLKLLQSSARELRPLLVFIWAKLLAVDSVRNDLTVSIHAYLQHHVILTDLSYLASKSIYTWLSYMASVLLPPVEHRSPSRCVLCCCLSFSSSCNWNAQSVLFSLHLFSRYLTQWLRDSKLSPSQDSTCAHDRYMKALCWFWYFWWYPTNIRAPRALL